MKFLANPIQRKKEKMMPTGFNEAHLDFSPGIPFRASLVAVSKESACSAEDPDLIAWLGRSPGEGNGNLLQCSCLENPMDRGA